MKNRTIRMLEFWEYEGEAFTEYLNEMAGQGWFLKRFWGGFLCFERGKPGTRRYLAAAMPGVSVFDGEDTWEAKRFRERYERAGWKLQCSKVVWQIFYCDAVDGERICRVPADTEEELKEDPLETLRQLRATTLSLGQIVSALLMSGLSFWLIATLFENPGRAFASNERLLTVVCISVIWFYYPFRLVAAACWYRRAERVLEATGRLPEVKLKGIKRRNRFSSSYLILLVLLLCVQTQSSSVRYAGVVRFAALILAGVVVVAVNSLILWWVREHGSGDRRENAIGYGVGSVFIGTIVVMLMTGVIMRFVPDGENGRSYQRQGEFPVAFSELGFQADDRGGESSRSVFGLYQRESGTRIGEDGQEEYLILEYYENRIPAVIAKTRNRYPEEFGDVREAVGEELYSDGDIRVMHYHYQLKAQENPYIIRDAGKGRDLYMISDRNRMFLAMYGAGASEEDEKTIVELALKSALQTEDVWYTGAEK